MTKDEVIAILQKRVDTARWDSLVYKKLLETAIKSIQDFVPDSCFEEEPTPKKYVYFVSYYGMIGSKGGHGHGEMTADRAVKSWNDIQILSNTIKFDNNLDKVVILNFQLLRTE